MKSQTYIFPQDFNILADSDRVALIGKQGNSIFKVLFYYPIYSAGIGAILNYSILLVSYYNILSRCICRGNTCLCSMDSTWPIHYKQSQEGLF